MSATLTAPTRPRADTAKPTHGVHVRCQVGAPHVVTICGIHLGWDEETDEGDFCVVCRDLHVCPVCGSPVVVPA